MPKFKQLLTIWSWSWTYQQKIVFFQSLKGYVIQTKGSNEDLFHYLWYFFQQIFNSEKHLYSAKYFIRLNSIYFAVLQKWIFIALKLTNKGMFSIAF